MFKEDYFIILVDDEPLARKLLSERLSRISNVHLAGSFPNGERAKAFLMENVVDMVITDIKMPVMDGLSLAQTIQKIDPLCTVVIVSGYSEFEYARTALQFGVKNYLLKPLQFSHVQEVVEEGRKLSIQLRQRQSSVRKCNYQMLEKAIHRNSFEEWEKPINDLLTQAGVIVQITNIVSDDTMDETTHQIYKNIMEDRLPGSIILYLGISGNQITYLIIPAKKPEQHTVTAVLEHLNRILKEPVLWEIVGKISNAKELSEVMYRCKETDNMNLISLACRYMEQNMGRAFTRDEVAAQVYLSPAYFGQLFKKTVGIGYAEYLTQLRIDRAKSLLQDRISIREVAEAVGFHDVKYFSEVFRTKTGQTPSEFRKSILRDRLGQRGAP